VVLIARIRNRKIRSEGTEGARVRDKGFAYFIYKTNK